VSRRSITVRLVVDVSGEVTTSALRDAARKRLGIANQRITVPKGTLPDPDTKRVGVIHWSTAAVKQRLSK
jgi:hypothetical protein